MQYFEKLVKPLEQLGYKLYVAEGTLTSIVDVRTIANNRFVGYLAYTRGGGIELINCEVKEIQLLIGLLT